MLKTLASLSLSLLVTFQKSIAFAPASSHHSLPQHPKHRLPTSLQASKSHNDITSEADIVVIGSGLAGLSCAALLAHCGRKVLVLESHDTPGGCAHSWERKGFHFESGPSLYSGLSMDRSPNPLKNVMQIIEEDCEWITYDRWGTVLPSKEKFAAKLGPEEFADVLEKYGGPGAQEEFDRLMARMKPLSNAAQALTSLALREDPWAIITLLKYPKELLTTLSQGQQLNEPFAKVMEEIGIKNEFVKNWLDMLCFLLQGMPAASTMNAVMAYMLADWYRPGVVLDYPKGGSGAIADALVRGVTKHGSKVIMNAHVDEILVEDGRASGVKLADGTIVRAKEAVVSNADLFVTNSLLSAARQAGELPTEMAEEMDRLTSTQVDAPGAVRNLPSFIHLHAGIDATGLPEVPSADFPAQWAVIRDWERGVEAPRNIVLCSMPSLIDPTMAPSGKHVLHAYTPATEPYEDWANMDRQSSEYKKKKEDAADFLWSAIEEYIPDARKRAVPGTVQIGTPLTHERFLRRTAGSYGARIDVGKGETLPAHKTKLKGLYRTGDYSFPGIGVPATAAAGAIVANSIVSVGDHLKMLNKIRLPS
ncbi:hypothetical protein MPSEU_000068200 [Mayamaea pseudoterrestris]|nr:hypothetical protein MPSEU_000068200 [Mayamaea pseudoterrestris]